LIRTIEQIENISNEEFESLQKEGQRYAMRYLYPPLEKNLDVFLKK
jgi:hypothetical protein